MTKEIEKFIYGGSEIEFDLTGIEIMVNATEMGKIFNKKAKDFLKIETTKEYMEALSEEENIPLEEISKIIYGGKNAGTWMHRQLALKFAGWLNARFEVWVYKVIEKIMIGDTAKIKSNHENLQIIINRIKEIDSTASVIMKERWKLVKQKEVLEIANFEALGLRMN